MADLTITEENFQEEVLNAKLPVLVDFWATWCGPCIMMGNELKTIPKNNGKFIVAKLNVDEQPSLAVQYGIDAIPTIILFKDGAPVKKVVGYRKKDELLYELELN